MNFKFNIKTENGTEVYHSRYNDKYEISLEIKNGKGKFYVIHKDRDGNMYELPETFTSPEKAEKAILYRD